MNIKQAIETNYAGMFVDLNDAEKKDQINAIKHIQHLAMLSRINIENIDLLNFAASKGKIYVDKKKLNELFFHLSQKAKPTVTIPTEAYSAEALEFNAGLRKTYEENRNKNIKKCEENIRYFSNDLRGYSENVISCAAKIQNLRMELLAYGKDTFENDKDFASISANIFKNKDFTYIGKSNYWTGGFEFTTSQEIVISHINPIAGINYTVNLGQLLLTLRPNTGLIRVTKYKNNLSIGNYFHPHVSYDGIICWGEASNRVGTLISLGKWDEVLTYLHSNLINYNHASAYVLIDQFVAEDKKLSAICSKCNFTQRMCTCPQCGYCGKKGDLCKCTPCKHCGEPNHQNCRCCQICGDADYEKCSCVTKTNENE